ncbi:ABC transporter ATP-binding protein [Numidum massiliense]|uniref:ABC transporter ATP-binding protein n=1 Tax=Numidum massiliense TaxID=1522315 RepID=UPI0009EA4E17|nr:ABC transporter ATP-binding protein [Numidum massiliense]
MAASTGTGQLTEKGGDHAPVFPTEGGKRRVSINESHATIAREDNQLLDRGAKGDKDNGHSQPLISVERVDKSFGGKPVLHNVTFHMNRGEIVGLLGPNGAGKTTLIRLLNGVIIPNAGKVAVAGSDPFRHGNKLRARSGTLTETAGLYEHMSGRDNLQFFSDLYGVDDRARIDELLAQFALTEHQHKKVGTYSTGMKKRLGLAKVLLHRPHILFLDEPTNGLDPEGIRMVLAYIKELNEQQGTTVLICSHILDQLAAVCDRYIFIDGGSVIEQGSLHEIEQKYLTETMLKVETDWHGVAGRVAGCSFERLSERELLFTLPEKNKIPALLRTLSQEADVFAAEIVNRDLETLYFKIRGGANRE